MRRGNDMRQAPVQTKGFTLIEILLAVLIFSVVALSLYGTFAAGIRLNRQGEAALRAQREAFWAMAQLTKDLEQNIFYDFSGSYPQQKSFVGKSDSVECIIATGNGLRAVRYSLESLAAGEVRQTVIGMTSQKNVTVENKTITDVPLLVLVREEQPFPQFLQNGFTGAQRDVLSRRVPAGGLKISYAKADSAKQVSRVAVRWVDSWSGKKSPQRVRVVLLFQADRGVAKTFTREIFIPTGTLYEE